MIEHRRLAWERSAEWPLTGAAILFLVAYAWPILDPGLHSSMRISLEWITWTTWAMFAVDYVTRWMLSLDRRAFVRGNLLDLAVVVLPILRPLRVLRLITLLSSLNRRMSSSLRGKVAVYVCGATVLVVFCSALAELRTERRNPDANITTFADALWWAMSTISTVGYGDRYPTTGEGRLIAGLLMLGGIALLGVVTASLASWLLERVRQVEEESQSATRHDIQELSRQIEALQHEVTALRAHPLDRGKE